MKNNLENQDIKTDKPVPMSYEALKADRDAQQKRADALAVENSNMREALDSIRIYSSDTLSGPSGYVLNMVEWLREGIKHIHGLSETNPQPLRGLNSDNAALKQFIVQHCYVIKQCCGAEDDDEFEAFVSATDYMPDTPATDASLAAIERQAGIEAVEEAAYSLYGKGYIFDTIMGYAAELREAK